MDEDQTKLGGPVTLSTSRMTIPGTLFPLEPRKLALAFLGSLGLFFLAGWVPALLHRVTLLAGRSLEGSLSGNLFALHGTWMFFLIALPALPSAFGSLLLKRELRARTWAFPRLATLGLYCYLLGSVCLLAGTLTGNIPSTWILDPITGGASGSALIPAQCGVILICLACLIGAINTVVSLFQAVKRGRRWFDLGQLAWAFGLGALMTILCAPLLIILLGLSLSEQGLGMVFFSTAGDGDIQLYSRFFWLFVRPAFYSILLPMIGLIGAIVEDHTRMPKGNRVIPVALLALAILGVLGSGGHAAVQSFAVLPLIYSLANSLSIVPLFLILGNWLKALWLAPSGFSAALAYALSAVLLAFAGGLSGLLLAAGAPGNELPTTVFVVAHLHFILAGSLAATVFGGLHLGWPDLTGRLLSNGPGYAGAAALFIGINLAFLPQFLLGFAGLPRRMSGFPGEFDVLQTFSTAGMTLLVLAYLIPLGHLVLNTRLADLVASSERNSAVKARPALPEKD